MVTNLRSAVPKLDDLAATMRLHQADICCVTESWGHKDIPDQALTINGYTMIRRDRGGHRKGGGLPVYVNEHIAFNVWSELRSPAIESLWLTMRSTRMPRQFSHLSLGLVYHPPDGAAREMTDHINYAIDHICAKHPCSGLAITGDFNQLPTHRFAENATLKQLVK